MRHEDLVKEIQQGDQEALEALWDEYKRFARYIVKRYTPKPAVDADDLMQCAFLGVCTAALAYDGRYDLTSLIAWCIRRECRRALSLDRRREPDFVSYDAPMGDEPEDGTFLDNIPDDDLRDAVMVVELQELRRAVQEAVRALPERQSAIIRQHYFEGRTLEDIAHSEGVSRERIRQIEDKGFDQLSKSKQLAPYVEYIAPCKGVGVRNFQIHQTSAVEYAAIKNIENQEKALKQAAKRERKRLDRMAAKGEFSQNVADSLYEIWLYEHGMPLEAQMED